MVMDPDEKDAKFYSDNGLVKDLPAEYANFRAARPWLDSEKAIFREKYVYLHVQISGIGGGV